MLLLAFILFASNCGKIRTGTVTLNDCLSKNIAIKPNHLASGFVYKRSVKAKKEIKLYHCNEEEVEKLKPYFQEFIDEFTATFYSFENRGRDRSFTAAYGDKLRIYPVSGLLDKMKKSDLAFTCHCGSTIVEYSKFKTGSICPDDVDSSSFVKALYFDATYSIKSDNDIMQAKVCNTVDYFALNKLRDWKSYWTETYS